MCLVYIFAPTDTFSAETAVTAVDRATNEATATFTVTRDTAPPVVTVTAGGAPTVTVEWTADDGTGAGVESYDLDVSIDGGAWERLLTNTQSTNTQYPGEFLHHYTFRVTAMVPLRYAPGMLRKPRRQRRAG